jgi:hypothetical protein
MQTGLRNEPECDAMQLDRETLERHFGDLWPVHNHGFTSLLIECRKHFGGDLNAMLVLAVMGDRTLPSERVRGLSYDDFRSGRRTEVQKKLINVQSIADSTGIPRETVRRKVAWLIERGWVEKDGAGSLLVTAQAAVDLAPATRATFEYLLEVGNGLLRMVGPTGY